VDAELQALWTTATAHGVRIVEDPSPPDHARFIGLFEGHTITLFPNAAPPFGRWFTIAHLYGHMVQMSAPTARVRRSNELVFRLGETLDADDVQLIYDHEREAAELGRRLIAQAHPVSRDLDLRYSRFFHADFHYLVNVIETKESGPPVFDRYYKREPIPRDPILPDARPLLNLKTTTPSTERIVVV